MRWLALTTATGLALLSIASGSKLTPPVLPLTVRNPYLSTWLGDARINPWNKWPMFWTGEEVLIHHVPPTCSTWETTVYEQKAYFWS